MKDRTRFKYMTVADRLWYILTHESELNHELRCSLRSPYLTDALWYAVDTLPNGKSKRALEYVARNPSAEFHFGGKDAVGPAIKKAISMILAAA